MFRKILVTAAMLAAFGHAYAAVDVNTANEDALRGIKGIGPAKAKAILEERSAHGPFKDPADLGPAMIHSVIAVGVAQVTVGMIRPTARMTEALAVV